ncbi:MAG: hypothetical protein K9N06_01345 [Candidatus Cloacimonetes bacterium]|nr:hypothetical protein [Candidatus Cloacimonadota bacterium]
MKRILMLIILLTVSILAADNQDDQLWQKAQEIARANWNWVAGVIEIRVAALDEDGEEMMPTDLMFSYELEDGEITGYYDGGKRMDSLVPESDQMVQEMLKQDMTPDSASIFLNDGNWNLQVTRTGIEKKIRKMNCVEFSYTCQQPDEDGMIIPVQGNIWLDSETGAPVYDEQSMQPPVDMVKGITNKITYNYKKGDWTVKSIESITSVEAMGQSMQMKNKMDFKKYWRYKPEGF